MDIANFAGAVSQLSLGEFLFFKGKKNTYPTSYSFLVYTYSNKIFYKNKMGDLTCINMLF